MSSHADTYCDCKDCLHTQVDRLAAENQQLREALEHADVHLATALGGGISFMTVKHDVDHARRVIADALAAVVEK